MPFLAFLNCGDLTPFGIGTCGGYTGRSPVLGISLGHADERAASGLWRDNVPLLSCDLGVICGIYIYIHIHIYLLYSGIFTLNLGLGIAILGLEREQGRFRESTEGARGRSGGVSRKHGGATRDAQGEHRGSKREHYGAVQGRSRWQPEMAPSLSAWATIFVFQYLDSPICDIN